jgi:hypothetical protein
MAVSRKARSSSPVEATPRAEVRTSAGGAGVKFRFVHITGDSARLLLRNGAKSLGPRLEKAVQYPAQTANETRASELEIAALIGDIQLGPFHLEQTEQKTRLDFLRCVEAINTNCLRVHRHESSRKITLVLNDKIEADFFLSNIVGYSLLIPLKDNYSEILKDDPLTFFNAKYATVYGNECIAAPGEQFSTLLIEELVSFPFPLGPKDMEPRDEYTAKFVLNELYNHFDYFVPSLDYTPQDGFTSSLETPLPKLLCWSPVRWRGAKQAAIAGFKRVPTKSPKGLRFAKFELDLSQKLDATEWRREKKILRRIGKLKEAVLGHHQHQTDDSHEDLTNLSVVTDAPGVTRGAKPDQRGNSKESDEGDSLAQLRLPKQVATVEQMKALQRKVIGLNERMSKALEPFVEEFETVLSEAEFGVSSELRVNQQTADVCNYVAKRLERGFVCPKEAQPKSGIAREEIAATLRCYSAPGQPEGVISFEHSRKDGPGRHSHGGFTRWARLKLSNIHKAIESIIR